MDEKLSALRHSASHVLADAVLRLFPGTKLAIGPSIEEGFYYDFDSSAAFSLENLEKIEKKMSEIINADYEFIKKETSREEAVKFFTERGEKYKLELIDGFPAGEKITLYSHDRFTDLCRGPHVKSTGEIKYFKLLSVAGAYWRGSEKREQLQRIYGTAFFTRGELDEYLNKLEEAKKRDHRRLGAQLGLFSVHEEVGGGLIHWHPNGAVVRDAIENFWKEQHSKNGYQMVYTPHIASEEIYRISGHLAKYAELMYSPMDIDGKPFRVKPMNCPGHIMIYKSRLHSYRELPLRLAELGTVYRREKSGVLHGLMRVRGFTIDDAHIFCMSEQLEEEMLRVFDFTVKFLKTFGFSEYEIYLATKPEECVGADADWEKATASLKNAIEKTGYKYEIDEGGGAFYGPKIDLKIKDVLGRPWQCATIQFDFNLPKQFDVTYRAADGKDVQAVMIHRALLGSLERFFGVLIEHYAGAFPAWLAPVQAVVLPVSEKQSDYATKVTEALAAEGLRVKNDSSNGTLGYRIREATVNKVPYILVAGEKEKQSGKIAVRSRDGKDLGQMDIGVFISKIKEEINAKT
jgi:threonyl-tRNA synthetase